MKVLFISHYQDGNTGWANASKNYILAMDSVGIDVVPVGLKLNDDSPDIPDRIKELEKKSIRDCDVCIQCVLPHHLEYNGFFKKNIAISMYETYYNKSDWSSKINMMDELWTPSTYSRDCLETSGVKIPAKIVPLAFDMSKYEKDYGKMEHPALDGNVIFYTIADLNIRKNLAATIRAFHLAFTPNMPVKLLIKTSRYGMSPEECASIVDEECSKIKKAMKLYRRIEDYIPELIITHQISEEELMQIHSSCDVFVSSSHGEAWSVPLFEATAMGKITIAPNEMFDYNVTYGVDSHVGIVNGMNDSFFELYSGREMWSNVDELQLSKKMLKAYHAVQKDIEYDKVNLDRFSYESVGNQIKELICQN